jgi:hypothetical protein
MQKEQSKPGPAVPNGTQHQSLPGKTGEGISNFEKMNSRQVLPGGMLGIYHFHTKKRSYGNIAG